MKVTVFGLGSMGSYLACHLRGAGPAVKLSLVGRERTVRVVRDSGIRYWDQVRGDSASYHFDAVHTMATAEGDQDLVVVAVKSMDQQAAAGDIASLLKEDGSAVFVANGIPWWWNYRGTSDVTPPAENDALWALVRPSRAIACVATSSNMLDAPGVVRHNGFNSWLLGEPTGVDSGRVATAVDLFRSCGLGARGATDVRSAIWKKLRLNIPNHAIASLTRLTTDHIFARVDLRRLSIELVKEVESVAAAAGSDIGSLTEPEMIDLLEPKAPGARPSMLQDVLAGNRLEVDAVFSRVLSLADEHGISSPVLRTCHALLVGIDQQLQQKRG